MVLVDTNVLVYAAHAEVAARTLEEVLDPLADSGG